jgi:hypothetical protein
MMFWKNLKVDPVGKKLAQYKQKWLNHVNMTEDIGLREQLLACRPVGRRRPGRLLKRLLDGYSCEAETGHNLVIRRISFVHFCHRILCISHSEETQRINIQWLKWPFSILINFYKLSTTKLFRSICAPCTVRNIRFQMFASDVCGLYSVWAEVTVARPMQSRCPKIAARLSITSL